MSSAELRRILRDKFNESELRTLCFDLDVDYDSLGGESKADKARELIGFYERRGDLIGLAMNVAALRPHLFGQCNVPKLSQEALSNGGSEWRQTVMFVLGVIDGKVDRLDGRLTNLERSRFAFYPFVWRAALVVTVLLTLLNIGHLIF